MVKPPEPITKASQSDHAKEHHHQKKPPLAEDHKTKDHAIGRKDAAHERELPRKKK